MKALFLDRDGVLNTRLPARYVRYPHEVEICAKVKNALQNLSSHFDVKLVVTNQQGIGKGLMTENDLSRVHHFMAQNIGLGTINRFYHCPDLANSGSASRKPETGMYAQAIRDYPGIIPENSWMVGDSASDILFGQRANLNCCLVTSNPEEVAKVNDHEIQPCIKVESLWAFYEWLVTQD